MDEIWRQIAEWSDKKTTVEISNLGRLRRMWVFEPSIGNKGYRTIAILEGG